MNDPKKQLLDPFSTMITLIELAFRAKGSKFGITNHAIEIQLQNNVIQNSYDIFNIQSSQAYQRYWNADSRENVSKLGYTLIRIIEWYIIPTFEAKQNKKQNAAVAAENVFSPEEIEELWLSLYNLTNYLCKGLEKLIETYEDGNVIWTIQYYINLLQESLL